MHSYSYYDHYAQYGYNVCICSATDMRATVYLILGSMRSTICKTQPQDLFYVAYDGVCRASVLSLAAGTSSAASVRNVSGILKFGRTELRVYAALNQSTSSAQHRHPST